MVVEVKMPSAAVVPVENMESDCLGKIVKIDSGRHAFMGNILARWHDVVIDLSDGCPWDKKSWTNVFVEILPRGTTVTLTQN